MRRLHRAVAELMDVEMSVELDHEDAFGLNGQLVVDGQGAEMIARDPQEEIARAARLAGRFAFPVRASLRRPRRFQK